MRAKIDSGKGLELRTLILGYTWQIGLPLSTILQYTSFEFLNGLFLPVYFVLHSFEFFRSMFSACE